MQIYILRLFDQELLKFSAVNTGDTPEVHIIWFNSQAKSLLPKGLDTTDKSLASWLRHRKIPKNRAYIQSFLAKAGLSANDTLGIIDLSKGLSLNDSYWVTREGFNKTFAQCNLYDNKFSNILAEIAFTGYGSSSRTALASSPEFTTNGALPKCWRRHDGKIFLYKGGTEGASNTGNEPYSEYYACQIAQILGINSVAYNLAKWKDRLCSTCELFSSKEVSFVPISSILKGCTMTEVIEYYDNLGMPYRNALGDMFILDAVICNTDRHFGNFGFCVDARTNKLIGPAPLFDHGNSLFNFASRLELESKQAFLNFANAQTPRCYNDFFETAKPYVTARHRQGLRQLLNFNFKKHPRYNLDKKRLEYMAMAVQNRAARLL